MRFLLLATAMTLIFTGHARADWQYTKWGMTVDQVKEAAQGKAKPISDPGQNNKQAEALLIVPYKADRFVFTANFLFNRQSRLLQYVSLNLDNPADCQDLIETLRSRYGNPFQEIGPTNILHRLVWRDTKNGNMVNVAQIGNNSCSMMYDEISSEGSGL